jgi:sarcosine oxidase subunit gamma
MTSVSPLQNVHKKGLFGDHEDKDEKNLIKISEVTNLLIFQIVQHKRSNVSLRDIKVGELNLSNKALEVNFNNDTRILWTGPNNWLLTSKNKELLKNIHETFNETDFAITDLSHSRAVIELEGENTKEVLKKGCPFNFNELNKNTSINSVFNGITVTIDMIEDSPNKMKLYALRSFGESLHHSITDACLEFGYKNI